MMKTLKQMADRVHASPLMTHMREMAYGAPVQEHIDAARKNNAAQDARAAAEAKRERRRAKNRASTTGSRP